MVEAEALVFQHEQRPGRRSAGQQRAVGVGKEGRQPQFADPGQEAQGEDFLVRNLGPGRQFLAGDGGGQERLQKPA